MRGYIDEIKKRILPVLRRHRISKAGVFGSSVSGNLKKDSDIDILVKVDDDISLLDFIGIKLELEDVLGKKVDLIEYDSIKQSLRERILKEQVVIL